MFMLTISIVIALGFISCEDKSGSQSVSDYDMEGFPPVPEVVQNSADPLIFPEVDAKELAAAKKHGDFGHSEFFHYLNSNFEANRYYSTEGLIEDSEIVTYIYENDIEYESQIYLSKPRHYLENYILPNTDMAKVKEIMALVYPDVEFECKERGTYCEYSLYADREVKHIFLTELESSMKVGITYREK